MEEKVMFKVLLVDDKTDNLYLLQSLLNANGFVTISAKNGAEALGLIRNNIPDLIISDILMPVMDGFTLCRECKKDKILKSIPFFFYTATYTDSKDEEFALGLGADRFVLKPQEPDEFLKIINDFLSEVSLKKVKPRRVVQKQENIVLKEYNEVLIRKIEDKMVQTEKAEKELRKYARELELEIQERKNKEISLQESQQLFQTLARVSPVGIFKTDHNGETTYVNPKWSELSGLSAEEAFGNGWLKAVHPDDRMKLSDSWTDSINSRRESNAEYRFLKPDGTVVWVIGKAVPESIDNELTGYIGTITDITERKKAHDALVQSELKYRELVTQSPDGIFIVDLSGRFLSVNRAICESLKYTEEEILQKNITEIIPEEYHYVYKQRLGMVLKGESSTSSSEYEVKGSDGAIHFVEVLSVPYFKEKEIIGFQGIARDITERKKFEDELIRSKIKAEESDKLKTAFLHNISHEIRTPLNAIVGFSSLLADTGLDEGSKISYINTITQSSNQLLGIISDIIEISNIEAGILKCSKAEIRINMVLQQLYDQFYPIAYGKGLQFKTKLTLPDNEARIHADKTKFNQVLTNLLSNAFKFTPVGHIEFGYSCSDHFLNFFVSDTGIGIPEDQFQKIFDRFYQVEHMMARHFEGTGLGLSISKAYVELMGGKIWVESDPGKGSIFYFTLPYDKSPALTDEPSVLSNDIAFKYAVSILVAEDDDNNFNLIVKFLNDPKLNLIRAKNGLEAVNYCQSGKPVDLVLMDLKMPVMDGYEATRRIKEIKPDLHVIAQTAFVAENDKVFTCGCVDIITKPFTRSSLLEIIGKYLND